MHFFKQVFSLVQFRVFLLVQQKMLLFSLFLGVLIIPSVFFVSLATYTHAEKIYWDITLSAFFIIQTLLASYIASHLFRDERQNGGLFTLLSIGVNLKEWLWGNLLAIFWVFLLIHFIWLFLANLLVYLFFQINLSVLVFQSVLLSSFELMIVASMSFFFSLFLKPLYAWLLTLSFVAFIHSSSFIEQSLALMSRHSSELGALQSALLFVFKLLPPLEWMNLRDFVSFQRTFSWSYVGGVILLALLWSFFWQSLSEMRMRRMDL